MKKLMHGLISTLILFIAPLRAVTIPIDFIKTAHLTVGDKITRREITGATYHPSFSHKYMSNNVLKRRDWVEFDGNVTIPDSSIKKDNLITDPIYAVGYRPVNFSISSCAYNQQSNVYYAPGYRQHPYWIFLKNYKNLRYLLENK